MNWTDVEKTLDEVATALLEFQWANQAKKVANDNLDMAMDAQELAKAKLQKANGKWQDATNIMYNQATAKVSLIEIQR